ncbi:MAG: lysylphosphatidylglycerol synthase transmembrane domain-containing protein [Bacteroidota bacterium]
MKSDLHGEFTESQQEVLKSIRISKIILPIFLGVGVVIYLLWKQFNPDDFAQINWTRHSTLWVAASLGLLIIRHLAYATRLRILSDREFSWRKCIELIFIWEFSSAVSPTSIGGSAVALFVLSQEKLSTAKTTTLVIYSAVLDTLFFISTLPILLLLFGPRIIRPGMESLSDLDSWGYTFLGAYTFMAIYGALFFYGLFINPNSMKNMLLVVTRFKYLSRYREWAKTLGQDLIVASKEMARKSWRFHVGGFLSTATAWSCRFFLLNCLIIAFVDTIPITLKEQLVLYSRLETMFVIMAFSPTPGGAGFAEIVFWGFLKDYVPYKGVALIVASVWRLFTYYFYLFVGVIVIPNWIRTILNERKKRKLQQKTG